MGGSKVPKVLCLQIRGLHLRLERIAADRLQAADPQLAGPCASERRHQGLGAPSRERIDQPEKTDRPALPNMSRNSPFSSQASKGHRRAAGSPKRAR